ncbi:MAG: cysteine desulfurase NifS [Syntrophaceae bacterium CG2_30_49_12]|nr:MAG: cysteine desulfurase NifS [Syntrophaceae bacterium CG2_30_49_12]PIP07224.1 MAG: cysteine desulfurase NifS [Syntrophobacterales bacterium CG23_combo_of_CG06-09_8_20_14_all_48_27]PJC73141.1 MAG: cysteine desulfurase NifS [Syntrophobacterales bacterium CG_4_8_14_3_um_filter_49_14]
MKRIYLDHAATTPVDYRVVEAMLPCFHEVFGNPSSVHAIGQEARRIVEGVRSKIASFLAAKIEEIIFTSGGTESDNTAIKGVAQAMKDRGNHIITSSIEHHAVLETCKYLEKHGFHVTYLKNDKAGLVDPDEVRRAITGKTILISIMHANNEIGTIEPIAEIGKIARQRGIFFHTDAVQTFGHLPIDVNELHVDLLSASAHKLCGPKGVGILYVREGTKMVPFMHGGEQEGGRRASTHNVPGIVGLGKAVELAKETMGEEAEKLTSLRDKMIRGILEGIDDSVLNGHPVKRLPNNINVSLGYIEGEAIIMYLDREGIACATGSACTSASMEPSHVLAAIGLTHDFAHGSLRLTMGRATSEEDIVYVLKVLPVIADKLRSISPLYKKGR